MNKFKVAVIGCGTIANSAHIPAYMKNKEVEIIYFCDIRLERAEKMVEKYGCGEAVLDYKQVISDPKIDAISICTPNNCHSIIAVDALKAGKHVLCEKPAAYNLFEAIKMQEAQQKYSKMLNIGVVNRFNDSVNHIKQIIDSGELGEIYQVYVSFRSHRSIPGLGGAFTRTDIAGGGVLIDWGVHFLDVVMYCCGDPKPLTASAETFSKLGNDIKNYTYINMWAGPPVDDGIYDVEDAITGMVRTDGPIITLNGAWAQNIGEDEMFIDFCGTKAGIRFMYGADFTKYGARDGMLTKEIFAFNKTDMFQNEIDAFIGCIKSGEKLPSNIDTNIITAKLMDALYRSAESHKEVEI